MTIATPTQPAQPQTLAGAVLTEAPALLAAAAPAVSAVNPAAGLALQLAPVAATMLEAAFQLANAGVLSPADIATLWQKTGQGVYQSHMAWEAANAAKPA